MVNEESFAWLTLTTVSGMMDSITRKEKRLAESLSWAPAITSYLIALSNGAKNADPSHFNPFTKNRANLPAKGAKNNAPIKRGKPIPGISRNTAEGILLAVELGFINGAVWTDILPEYMNLEATAEGGK